jgi:hypothetical protein
MKRFRHSWERTLIVAIPLFLVGIFLIILSANVQKPWLATPLVNIGSFLLASVVLAIIFEFLQKRTFLEEVFEEARIVGQVREAKLSGFSTQFHDGVPWAELFQKNTHLQAMFAYASTWRNVHQEHIRRFLEQKSSSLSVILPNPEIPAIVDELGLRFQTNGDEVAARIRDAQAFIEDLARKYPGQINLYFVDRSPTFTFYIFETDVVFSTYRHRPDRGPIITLMGSRGGDLYRFVRDEWRGLTDEETNGGIVRKVL